VIGSDWAAGETPSVQETPVNDISAITPASPVEVDIVEAREAWSEYRLADGTVLRIKPVMIAILRVDGSYTADGEPVYNMKSTLVTDVRAPQQRNL
jgi:hypothetical protein